MVHDEVVMAGAWSFLHERDCGILQSALRRDGGVGVSRGAWWNTSLPMHARHGVRTATLQSTRIAQQLYQSLGREPAARYEEWVSR